MPITQSKYSSLTIPTKTYLKKFLHYKLGETFFAAGPHHIQKYLTNLLEKRVYNYHFTALNTQYNDKLTIFFSLSTFQKLGFGINPQHVIEFNNYIEELFDEELYGFCRDYIKYHEVGKKILASFAEDHNVRLTERQKRSLFQRHAKLEDARTAFAKKISLMIEEDISEENLKKMEYRARIRREKREKTFSQPVPQVYNAVLTLLFE